MNNTTTTATRSGFRVEDVSFKGARQQSEILKEGVTNAEFEEKEPEVPKSLTDEQVKAYLLKCIQSTTDNDKRKVFAHLVKCVDELAELKKENIKYKMKELQSSQMESTPDDVLD